MSAHDLPGRKLEDVAFADDRERGAIERRIAVEFGFRCAEKGWNLERTMEALARLENTSGR